MSQDNLIKLKSTVSGRIIYTRKNRKKLANAPKLELKKYDPTVRKRVIHKEVKK